MVLLTSPGIAVIVQARFASTRLPGKVLLPLAGHTVLAHVLARCQAIPGVATVCCATVASPEHDAIATEAERCGAFVFRGSESDVLDRYYQAARRLGVPVVMRVTSDCPLIDPAICRQVLDLRDQTSADYAANNTPPSWPHGLDCEAFTFAALERAAKTAQEPQQREHVTPWLRTTAGLRRANLAGPGTDAAQLRWTLDYPEDYEFLVKLFDRLPPWPTIPSTSDVIAVLERHPELLRYNAMRRDLARQAPNKQSLKQTS